MLWIQTFPVNLPDMVLIQYKNLLYSGQHGILKNPHGWKFVQMVHPVMGKSIVAQHPCKTPSNGGRPAALALCGLGNRNHHGLSTTSMLWYMIDWYTLGEYDIYIYIYIREIVSYIIYRTLFYRCFSNSCFLRCFFPENSIIKKTQNISRAR